MKRKRILIPALLLMFVLSLSAIGLAAKLKNDSLSIEKIFNYNKTRNQSPIVATVDGEEIRENDVKVLVELSHGQINEEQALNNKIKNKALLKEAKHLGYEATIEEAKMVAKDEREKLENYGTEEDKQEINLIIKYMNISYGEYWNEYCVEKYKDLITIGKYKNSIKAEIEKCQPNSSKIEKDKKYNETIDNLVAKLEIKYNIKVKGK